MFVLYIRANLQIGF